MFRAWFYTIRQEIVCVCKKLYNKKKSLLIALLTSCLLIVLIMLSWYFGLCLLSSFLHVISFRFLCISFFFIFILYKIYFYTSGCYSYIFIEKENCQFFLLKLLQSESKQQQNLVLFFFFLLFNYKPWYLLWSYDNLVLKLMTWL